MIYFFLVEKSTDIICLSSDEETEESARTAKEREDKSDWTFSSYSHEFILIVIQAFSEVQKRLVDFTNDRLNIPDSEVIRTSWNIGLCF